MIGLPASVKVLRKIKKRKKRKKKKIQKYGESFSYVAKLISCLFVIEDDFIISQSGK